MPPNDILIAEDDASAAQELRGLLQRLGYRVVGVVASGAEALRQTECLHPNVILMNVRLKGRRDGIQTGSLLRAHHDVPLIYVVDYGSQETIRRAASTAPLGYIFRPFDEKQIYATIETALIRHQLEGELRQNRQWLNTTLTSIGDGVIATDEHGLVRFMNPIAMQLTGWKQTDAVGKAIYEVFVLVDEVSRGLMDLSEMTSHKSSADSGQGFSGLLLPRNAEPVPLDANATVMHDEAGHVHGMVVVFRNVSRQREALREIQRQAARAEALMRVASQLNMDLKLETVLNTVCHIMNQTLQADGAAVILLDPRKKAYGVMAATIQEPALGAYLEPHLELPKQVIEALLSRQNPVHIIADGQAVASSPLSEVLEGADIQTLALAALFSGDVVTGALVSAYTRHPKAMSEDEIALFRGFADQASNAIRNAELFRQVLAGREHQRKLSKSLVEIQEAERRRLAKELHDHLGQVLTGLQFALETTKNEANEAERTKLSEIQSTVTDIIRQVREMSLNLRPAMLDDMGLVPTVQWHIDRYTRQTGIRVNFQCDEMFTRLPIEIETAAYRIIQEALTNVARHAGVNEVLVGLTARNHAVWIEVRDQGKGFDPSAETHEPSSGLSGMRERANLVGGYLGIKSSAHEGTQVVAVLPLTTQHLERRKHERTSPVS